MKILKKIIIALVVVILITFSFASEISDNDGSAFITKAEFDSLKSSFQSQIDTYNQGIDSKIDGAIAAYLAGFALPTQVAVTSMINNLQSYYWVKDWTPTKTQLGTVGRIYICITWHFNNCASGRGSATLVDGSTTTSLSTQDTTNYSEFIGASSTISRNNPQWMWVDSAQGEKTSYSGNNGTNETYTLVYRLNDTFTTPSKDAITILYKNRSWPEAQLVLAGGHTQLTVTGTSGKPTSYSAIKPTVASGESTWGSYAYSVNQYIDGSNHRGSLVGIKGWQQNDTAISLSDFFYALPDKKYTDSSIYTLNIDEIGNIGDKRKRNTADDPWTLKHGGNNSSWFKVWQYKYDFQRTAASTLTFKRTAVADGGETTDPNEKFGVYLYEHKVNKVGTTAKNYTVSNICLDDVSSLVNSFVAYGDGLPIFTASSKGRVKFQLNTGKLTTSSFEIRASKFGNTDMNSTPFATLTDRNATVTKNSASTTTNNLWDIEFNVKNGETYWIMCKPTTTDKIYVKTVGDIIINNKE